MDDEYIRKADAINAATQDSTENRTHSFKAGQARSASRIKALPSADVVQVVRCDDCIYYGSRRWCDLHSSVFEDNAFCSYGEKRGEE